MRREEICLYGYVCVDSMVNYQQWVEMEEESKELYQLIETQREKISELAKLLTQKG